MEPAENEWTQLLERFDLFAVECRALALLGLLALAQRIEEEHLVFFKRTELICEPVALLPFVLFSRL